MEITSLHLAWLAGLWDGEGSVGVAVERRRDQAVYIPQIQISMTDEATIMRAADIIREIGCAAVTYRWDEKKPQHKPAYGFSIRRTGYILRVARELVLHAYTKRALWGLINEFCELRVSRLGLDGEGRLKRGGKPGEWWTPYSPREKELVHALRELNRRGRHAPPADQ
jgi:hypothetical protein